MRATATKIITALATGILLAALGALSWNSSPRALTSFQLPPEPEADAVDHDEIIHEIERFYSVWRNHDKRTGCRESSQGNS